MADSNVIVFPDNRATPASEIGYKFPGGDRYRPACPLEDSPEVAEARKDTSGEGLLRLGAALRMQFRFTEAEKAYNEAEKLLPGDVRPFRQRSNCTLNRLLPERALEDLEICRSMGMDEADLSYKFGLCYYYLGQWDKAMSEEEICFLLNEDEMGIAALYWYTLAAWKKGVPPRYLENAWHPGMEVGHHTAYNAVVAFAAGSGTLEGLSAMAEKEDDDLAYSVLAYGLYVYLATHGNPVEADHWLTSVIPRSDVWIGFGYLGAWNDYLHLCN